MNWVYDFQLFLFDFDGLLVDTERLHYAAYMAMMERQGRKLNWSFGEYSALAHLNATAIRDTLYSQFPDLDPQWDQLYAEKKRLYLEFLHAGKVKLMPGVEPLLKALETAEIRRCVVTHSSLDQTLMIRRQLPILSTIPYWVTREDYGQAKPHPECYLRAIQLYGQPEDRIIGFEDTIRGLQALQRTPAVSVLICPSHHPLLEIALTQDVIHYESLEHIPQDVLL